MKILDKANEYLKIVTIRAIAHEMSAEWHRSTGTTLGVVATILSAIVGSTVFVVVSKNFALNGTGDFVFPPLSWGWRLFIYICIGLILILSPVLTGIQTFLNHPQQAEKHRVSFAGYFDLQQHLDRFIIKYEEVNSENNVNENALKELEEISKKIKTVLDNSLTLTDK